MRLSKVFSVLALLVAMSGCAKNDDKKSEPQAPAPAVEETKPQSKIEMPKVKYPAAIIWSEPRFFGHG